MGSFRYGKWRGVAYVVGTFFYRVYVSGGGRERRKMTADGGVESDREGERLGTFSSVGSVCCRTRTSVGWEFESETSSIALLAGRAAKNGRRGGGSTRDTCKGDSFISMRHWEHAAARWRSRIVGEC